MLAAMTPRRPSPMPAAAGFSLVECLLVAVLLAVGLLGLAGLQLATLRAQAGTRTRLVAETLAASTLERALAEVRQSGAGWSGTRRCPHDRDGRPARGTGAFYRVILTASPGPAATLRLRATVSWTAGQPPGPRSRSLERIVCP